MASIDNLVRRAKVIAAIRRFFDGRGFVEVDTPVRIAAPAPEPFIDCPPVGTGGFLRASPELQMKKLLAAGMELIYQIGPCFRDGEKGSRHNPEFTMIEWYRKGAGYEAIKEDMVLLVKGLMEAFAPDEDFRIREIPVRDAYLRFAGWDPWAQWDQDRFDFDMASKIEPALKEIGGGVFLMDYPVEAAALSRTRGDVAERWEFYWDGMEIAHCFGELCDIEEQAKRFNEAKIKRIELGASDYPIDGEFLEAVAAIGSASGVALGIERLLMVLFKASSISDVMVCD